MVLKFIKTRKGDVVEFDSDRIKNAVLKAYHAVSIIPNGELDNAMKQILSNLNDLNNKIQDDQLVSVEDIQDVVEHQLMDINKDVAKAYIIYRQKHSEERESEHKKQLEKLKKQKLMVEKNNGEKEPFDMNKVEEVYNRIAGKLSDVCTFDELKEKFKSYIVEGIKTSDITKLIVKSAIDLISVENVNWQFIAGRFYTLDLYKHASRNRGIPVSRLYSPESYKTLFDEYIKRGLYYKKFYDYYSEEDILKCGEYLKKKRDMTYNYTTVFMFNKRYLLNPNKHIMELPQEMYMSAALFLAIPEKKENRLEIALKIYEYCSSQKISLPTPTLLNARTNFHQLSSCFKFSIDDDLRAIYHGIENMAQISKFGGGIGVYLGHIRSKGSFIRNIKGASGGVTPWIKVINDTAIAVNQLGARLGSISVTLDIWHRDIHDFFDLQTETGDIRRKSFDVFPSISIPDLFMERVEDNQTWTLFDPKEVFDVTGKRIEDNFGDDFRNFYEQCENDSRITLKETVNAKDLFKQFMKTVVETGMPYVFFRDSSNKVNPNSHIGKVYSTQLCTEIIQNMKPARFKEEIVNGNEINIKYDTGDFVVCNLASINVAKVNKDKDIKEVIPIAMRILDNVVTLNFYPIKESELTAKKYRSVGLGFLGVAEFLATNGYMYDSEEGREVIDKVFEKYAYHTLETSNQLAKERGKYEYFKGSDWSKGILFGRDEKWYKENSKISDEWTDLIKSIKKHGLRFGYHLSPAPNTSTSLVVGTTAGVLPIYKKYFVETNVFASTVNVAPKLSKENFWYYKEYVNMSMTDIIDMVSVIQKRIDQSISFEWIINPMIVSPSEIYGYYMKARKQGIKTVYYVRSMSLDVKECVSCSG